MVGMNKDAKLEAEQLRARGNNVTLIQDAAKDDTITTRDATGRTVTHDLATPEGSRSFALTLGLPAAQTVKVADAIQGAQNDARDELAQLAQVFAKAERGEGMPSRLVLSGHNIGGGVWGDDNGRLSFDALEQLTDAMPKAAASVQDLHLSACYSGGERLMDRYRAMFPEAKTIWAYSGSAPGSASGAPTHQARWDAATRGDKEALSRALAEGSRKGENVAVWSKAGGYDNGKPRAPIADVMSAMQASARTTASFFTGASAIESSQHGPLRDHYNDVQRALQHPDLPATDKPAVEAERDRTIRMLFYGSNVAPKFQSANQAAIDAGFSAVGLTPPNFATLSRQDALTQLAAFEQKLPGAPAAAQSLAPLLASLRDLTPVAIPETWI